MATKFASAPNSCEIDKQINAAWAMQIKPVGADPSEYRYVRGLSSLSVAVAGNSVDASDLDSGDWDSQLKTTRSLTITAEGQYVYNPDLGILDPVIELLKISGEEIGARGKIDVRVWRTDADEGWETTANNDFASNSGARGELRTYTSTLGNSCAPTRIHSVKEGEHTKASVPIEAAEIDKILQPKGGAPEASTDGEAEASSQV